jgi:hypothetical protein
MAGEAPNVGDEYRDRAGGVHRTLAEATIAPAASCNSTDCQGSGETLAND